MLAGHEVFSQTAHISLGPFAHHGLQKTRYSRESSLRVRAPVGGRHSGVSDRRHNGAAARLVGAEFIGVHQVSTRGKRAGAATAAQLPVFASAAFARQPGRAQAGELFRVGPERAEGRRADITDFLLDVGARCDSAVLIDAGVVDARDATVALPAADTVDWCRRL